MTGKFASIELARLYETQGYFQDALEVYNGLDDNVLTGGAEVRAAKKRLETAIANEDTDDLPLSEAGGPADRIASALEDLNGNILDPSMPEPGPRAPKEKRIAGLMEKWLMFMVIQKRLKMFKKISARF